MKKTLVVNFGTLSKMGGIERIIISHMKYMVSQGVRVIWLKNARSSVIEDYNDFLLKNVEIVNISDNHIHWFKHEKIDFGIDEDIIVVSYTVIDMLRSMTLKNEFKSNKICCIYCVPDTTGKFFFIEQYFRGQFKNFIFNKVKSTLAQWNDAGVIVFCAITHIETFENHYAIRVNNRKEKLLPSLAEPMPLDEKALIKRSTRNGNFNIITTGRFDFPHKGYMLGLVKAFGRLRKTYPQMTLTFIGKGPHEKLLKDEINKLDDDSKKNVFLKGEVAYDQLSDYYKDKHLSVAVAGAASDAARYGVVSIVARNFCEGECEVYGFLPEVQSKTVSKEPGFLVDSYVEEVLKMTADDYKQRCINAHNAIRYNALGVAPNPWFFFDVAHKAQVYSMNNSELIFWKKINYYRKLRLLLERYFNI